MVEGSTNSTTNKEKSFHVHKLSVDDDFFPLEKSFRVNVDKDYEIFDQWLEILPTDQIVPVEVEYDPKTGRQKKVK